MWKAVRMVSLTFVIAAIYLAGLIPAKGLAILPGVTGIRPGVALPVAFSRMFGPAATWEARIREPPRRRVRGHADVAESVRVPREIVMGLVGYKLWGDLGPLSSDEEPTIRSVRQVLEYLGIALVTATATASIID